MVIYVRPSMCIARPFVQTNSGILITTGHSSFVISTCPCHCFYLSRTSCPPYSLTFGLVFGPWPPRSASSYALCLPAAYQFRICSTSTYRFQWSRGLRHGSTAARLLGLWVRIPPGGMDVFVECCVLSGRGLCDGLITRPEESYRL